MAKVNKKVNQDGDDFREFHIVVAIEWDGKPPKMTFYDHMHRMGIRVRGGNREEFESPLARRQSQDKKGLRKGVVFQEGLVLCRNNDVAIQVADKAKRFGASNVLIGKMFLDEFTLSEEDVKVLEALHQKQSQRGRKSLEDAGTYTVTCLQELSTFEAQLQAVPMTCPSCSAFRFTVHMGKQKVYQLPKSWSDVKDMWDYWLRSRFSIGADGKVNYEIPAYVKPSKDALAGLPPETPYVKQKEPFVDLPSSLRKEMTPELQLKIWDACYALSKFNDHDRIDGRLEVIGALWNADDDDDAVVYSMATPTKGYDIVDLCILMKRELAKYL